MMRAVILFAILYFSFIGHAFSQQAINWDMLYENAWRETEVSVIKQGKVTPLFTRGKPSLMNFNSVFSYFHKDGTRSGFNVDGEPFSGLFEITGERQILIKGDRYPSDIVKLTDSELIFQMPQQYTSPFTNITEPLITQTKYIKFDPCAVYESLKSGNWNDPAIWTCQKIPTINDKVEISQGHTITVPDHYSAYAKIIEHKGQLKFEKDAKLILGQ